MNAPLSAPRQAFRLSVTRVGGVSRITDRRVSWPWSLPRGFHPHGAEGPLTVLPQAAAAGLLPGDRWQHQLSVGEGAGLRLIEAGATAVHGGGAGPGAVRWRLDVAPGGLLLMCCQPYVLMPGAALDLTTEISLAEDARLVVMEGVCLTVPADVAQGWRSALTIRRTGSGVVLRDAQAADGDMLDRLGQGGSLAFGAATVLAPEQELEGLADALKAEVGVPGVYAAAGPLRHQAGIGLRLVCDTGGTLTRALAAAQTVIEDRLIG